MTNTIRILENSVINQIAAGEVVDRPAHMIKELCENSLDAGATELTVDFCDGGRMVTVRDNGSGIHPQEMILAIARHATSKISTSQDLSQIATYGFRGEALASIGAVSRLKIISRTRACGYGSQIESVFGEVGEVTEIGADEGTTILVTDLFQNMPARLKFLKTDSGEAAAIKIQLKALALANPKVSFRILQNGQLVYYWQKVESFKSRVEQVLEQNNMFCGEARVDAYRAEVIVGSPNETTGSSRQIWLFVRGRFVQDRSLQTAVVEAYRHLLMHGEYPIAVVHLDCDPEDLDVNVSPTKSQVKFREPGQAFRVVQRAVRGVLEKAPWLPQILGTSSARAENSSSLEDRSPEGSPSYDNQNLSFQTSETDRVQYKIKDSALYFSDHKMATIQPSVSSQVSLSRNLASSQASISQNVASFQTELASPSVNTASFPHAMPAQWSRLEILGQAHLTYIIAQNESAVLFIDQHAAHERVMFEKLMAGYRGGPVESQNFLLPPVVKIPEDAVAEILRTKFELEKLGLHLEQMGPDEIVIHAGPALIQPEGFHRMLERLAQEYAEFGEGFHIEKVISDLVATMACHSAIRAGQALSPSEMKGLLQKMDEFPLSCFCPHGRPVYVEYPIRKLERDFGRTV